MLMAAAISASADASKDGQATADETPGLVKSIYVLRCCSRRSESEGNQGIKPRYEKDDGTRPYPFAREREREREKERVSQTLLMPRGRKEREGEREPSFRTLACFQLALITLYQVLGSRRLGTLPTKPFASMATRNSRGRTSARGRGAILYSVTLAKEKRE